VSVSEVAGVPITTPSAGIPFNFESLMEGGTGLTPVSTPLVPSCSSQQRNSAGCVDLSSPDSVPPKLVSLWCHSGKEMQRWYQSGLLRHVALTWGEKVLLNTTKKMPLTVCEVWLLCCRVHTMCGCCSVHTGTVLKVRSKQSLLKHHHPHPHIWLVLETFLEALGFVLCIGYIYIYIYTHTRVWRALWIKRAFDTQMLVDPDCNVLSCWS
jgi:hypothetical protein